MSLEEFGEYFWAYIGNTIVTDLDRNVNNKEFCDSVCFDCYRIYQQSGVSRDVICKQAENILFNVFRYKPFLNS